jgi:hypothetical protein
LKLAFGESTVYPDTFENVLGKNRVNSNKAEALGDILSAAKADFDGGFAADLEASITGEIFADFVTLAKRALDEKQKDVAAVLASAALEDTLKRIGAANGLDVANKDMSAVISALKAARVIKGGVSKLLDRMPRIRKHAMHAEWTDITAEEVGSLVAFAEQLILTHFSSTG